MLLWVGYRCLKAAAMVLGNDEAQSFEMKVS